MAEMTTRLIIIENLDINKFRKDVEEHIHRFKETHWDVKVSYSSEDIFCEDDYWRIKYTAFIEYSTTDKTERTQEIGAPLDDPFRHHRPNDGLSM